MESLNFDVRSIVAASMERLNFDVRPWSIVAASIAVHGTVFTLLHTFLSRTLFGRLYNKLDKREQMRFDERFVAMVHACISCQGSIRAFFSILPKDINVMSIVEISGSYAYDTEKWKLAETYLCITLGYFLYDTVIYLFVSTHHPRIDLIHHFVSEGQYLMHILLRWGYFLPTFLQTNEISTPFVHLSWFSGKAGDYGYHTLGRLFSTFQLIFAVLFIIVRILFNTALFAVTCYSLYYYLFVVDTVPKLAISFSFINFVLYLVVQYVWLYRIIKIAMGAPDAGWKKDKKAKSPEDKKED